MEGAEEIEVLEISQEFHHFLENSSEDEINALKEILQEDALIRKSPFDELLQFLASKNMKKLESNLRKYINERTQGCTTSILNELFAKKNHVPSPHF